MEERLHPRFIRWLAVTVTTLLGLVVLFNRAVNPYCLFANDWLASQTKPETFTHLRLVKAMQVRHLRPQSVILGSSRAETGLDPAHTAWTNKPVYNLGLSDARLDEIKHYFQHACEVSHIRQAVLLLDFTAFLPGGQNAPDFREERFTGFFIEDHVLGLCSWDALMGSVNTFLGRPGEKRYLPDGSRDAEMESERVLAKGGTRKAFLAYEKRFLMGGIGNEGIRLDEKELQNFSDILEMARKHDVDLRLAVAPVHARYLEMLNRIGQGVLFEEWKRFITRMTEASRTSERAFPLLDFSGYNDFTTEPVPERGLARYYFEASHFTKALGDELLARIFEDATIVQPGGFGFRLTSSRLEEHLAAIREARELYRRDHAAELAKLPLPQ
jgi:hypothetical protein